MNTLERSRVGSIFVVFFSPFVFPFCFYVVFLESYLNTSLFSRFSLKVPSFSCNVCAFLVFFLDSQRFC